MTALRLIDIVLVAFSAPVLVLLGAPALGILAGAGIWIVQRFAELGLAKYAAGRKDIRNVIGLNLAGVFARAWLVAITILAVGLAGKREDGLAAAVLSLVAFTVYFVNTLLTRSLERNSVTP
jgi:hypothetical protein